jgi:hypothetical protein
MRKVFSLGTEGLGRSLTDEMGTVLSDQNIIEKNTGQA